MDFGEAVSRLKKKALKDSAGGQIDTSPVVPEGLPFPAVWEETNAAMRRWLAFCSRLSMEALDTYVKNQAHMDILFAQLAAFIQTERENVDTFRLTPVDMGFDLKAVKKGHVVATLFLDTSAPAFRKIS